MLPRCDSMCQMLCDTSYIDEEMEDLLGASIVYFKNFQITLPL